MKLPLKRITILALASLVLAGCATSPLSPFQKQFKKHPPTLEWLTEHVPAFKRQADTQPTPDHIALSDYMTGLLNAKLKEQDLLMEKYQRTHRELSLDWDNRGRGGAALRQPGYVHTLGGTNHLDRPLTADLPVQTVPQPEKTLIVSSLQKANDIQKGQGYSVYEMSRWERYCNQGKGMDKADWAFVIREGRRNVPVSLMGGCRPPK
ncbi:hypothetical protein [Azomonas macrocytogenes]|uniref:Lipoprotein n=1 Tax=Azomonas macrocytogenes TaxID=69962 RepID=A0A839TB17_AZOMA|nr:hypothetical protein [Azomonas macrocytogenes]MBB3105245.1 hypothetical protein [Azomonas macrocytogenes]